MNLNTQQLVVRAWQKGLAIPAFNIPYLPMVEPVVHALRDTKAIGLLQVARLEWEKFESGNLTAVRDEYDRHKDERYTRLHLDHVPVIDEDDQPVDYLAIIQEAISLGYESVMVDGSRLPLSENIDATREVVDMGHAATVPVEAELGAVMGHEAGPLPPYEELFRSRKGFTDPDEAAKFVQETNVDWLSVAVGNIHGAISAAKKKEAKLTARLDIEHLERLKAATNIPLVLHGGTGIPADLVRESIRAGIAKINIATAIRQPYETGIPESVSVARERVYQATVQLIRDELQLGASAEQLHE